VTVRRPWRVFGALKTSPPRLVSSSACSTRKAPPSRLMSWLAQRQQLAPSQASGDRHCDDGVNAGSIFPTCAEVKFPRRRVAVISRRMIWGSIFRWPTARRLCRDWRVNDGLGADVLRSRTRSLDLDDDGVMEETIEERGGDNWVAEDLAPFGKATVGGEDHGGALAAGIDELEEQVAAARNDRQISDLVHDQERGPAKESDALAQLPFRFGLGEFTASTPRAVARWLLPVRGGPRKWITSLRSMKSS